MSKRSPVYITDNAGHPLVRWRTKHKISQAELAARLTRRLHKAVAASTVCRLERGEIRRPTPYLLNGIVAETGNRVKLQDLMSACV